MARDLWEYWTDPHQLLFRGIAPFLADEGQRARWARKLRLWSAACCSRLGPFLPSQLLGEAQNLLFGLADGHLTEDQFSARVGALRGRSGSLLAGVVENETGSSDPALAALFGALGPDSLRAAERGGLATSRVRVEALFGEYDERDEEDEALAREDAPLAALLREVAGNPFCPVAFDPAWRTSDVLAIAQQCYDSRDFTPLPILADALQDAGCNADELLAHLRSETEHVRGCWALDLVLGR